jgi:hypothetical protein
MLLNISLFISILFTVMSLVMAIGYSISGHKRSGMFCLNMSIILLLAAINWAFVAGAESLPLLRFAAYIIALANGVAAMRTVKQGIFHSTEP